METQAPSNFTNICFYLLLCPADTFLPFTLESPLISHGMDNEKSEYSPRELFIYLEILP